MNGDALRGVLLDWLRLYRPLAVARSEVEIRTSRADVLTVEPGKLSGWEIKGDGDDFHRLRRQVVSYSFVCDECWLVVGERLMIAAPQAVPSWWGILACDGDALAEIRGAEPNPETPNPRTMLSLLWSVELKAALHLLGAGFCSSWSKWKLSNRLAELLGEEGTRACARGMLARRVENGWGLRAIEAARRVYCVDWRA